MREAGDEPQLDGIAVGQEHDDGNRPGRALGGLDRHRAEREDRVEVEPSELSRQFGESIELSLGASPLDDEILALDVSCSGMTAGRALAAVGADAAEHLPGVRIPSRYIFDAVSATRGTARGPVSAVSRNRRRSIPGR